MQVKLIDMVHSLSKAMDLISPTVVNHHNRVGYVSAQLAGVLELDSQMQSDVLIAGLMHDVGALSLRSRLDALQFEADGSVHAEAGYRLIRSFEDFTVVARLIRYHHTPWSRMQAMGPEEAPPEGNLINLADRVDVLLRVLPDPGPQLKTLVDRLHSVPTGFFRSTYVEALEELAQDDVFLQQVREPGKHLHSMADERPEERMLGLDEMLSFSRLFSHIIDFRSRFTATHSRGVAATAAELSRLAGCNEEESKTMLVAGNLHDLGKLAVPSELLEKPAQLTEEEFAVVRSHAEYSDQILSGVPGLEIIKEWAASHHERLDGRGYPHKLSEKNLCPGARIVAVADVFTAITEDRPYRAGMTKSQVERVLLDMSAKNALDRDVINILLRNYDTVNAARITAQDMALVEFSTFNGQDAAAGALQVV